MKETYFGKEFEVIKVRDVSMVCFDLVSAIEFMHLAVANGERILGGDIVIKKNNEYEYSYDNWYSQSKDPTETLEVALNYLRLILKNFPLVTWRVVVTTERY